MSTRRMYRRRFLNQPGHHAGAYAIAEVNVFAGRKNSTGHIAASLIIADCNRVAELDFHAGDEASVANALHKVRLLRDIVTQFTATYESAIEEWRAASESEPPAT